jgi:hypothetical protein
MPGARSAGDRCRTKTPRPEPLAPRRGRKRGGAAAARKRRRSFIARARTATVVLKHDRSPTLVIELDGRDRLLAQAMRHGELFVTWRGVSAITRTPGYQDRSLPHAVDLSYDLENACISGKSTKWHQGFAIVQTRPLAQ